jgi:hypothetical protein
MKRSIDKLKDDNLLLEQEVSKLKSERKIFYERLDDVKHTIDESN